MTRPLRLELAGGLYHVTSRGNCRQDIYLNDEDRKIWLGILAEACSRFHWICHAYCLMSNHYHIVIETVDGHLSNGMRHLNGIYTQGFNRRHARVGHVYQGRYKAILIEKDNYLLELSRYVVLNPVRAGMVKEAIDWEWSSYRALIGLAMPQTWLHTDWILGRFGSNRELAIADYKDFVKAGMGLPSVWEQLTQQIYLGDNNFVQSMQKRINPNGNRQSEIPRAQRRSLAKPLNFYVTEFENAKQGMQRAYASGDFSMQTIADAFGVHYSTVSRAIKTSKT